MSSTDIRRQQEELDKKRASMPIDGRQVAALEKIADTLSRIQKELISINRGIQDLVKKR